MAYINTIKSAYHGLVNKHAKNQQKRGHTPDLSPNFWAIGGGYRYSRQQKSTRLATQ